MLREQGEGRHQESEVKDLRKALPRSLHLNSMFGGGGEEGLQTYKYWSTGQVIGKTTCTKENNKIKRERSEFFL